MTARPGAGRGDDRTRHHHVLPRGTVRSPNIWEHPAIYEVENHAVDRDGLIEQAMREVDDWSLACLEIAGDPQRVSEWLGETVEAPLEDVKVEWVAPHGTPGIIAAQFQTPNGLVRV